MNKGKWLLLTAVLFIAIAVVGFIFRKNVVSEFSKFSSTGNVVVVEPLPWDPAKRGNSAMIDYVKDVYAITAVPGMPFANTVNANYLLNEKIPESRKESLEYYIELISQLERSGRLQDAVDKIAVFENSVIYKKLSDEEMSLWYEMAGTVWLRYGEELNYNNSADGNYCIWPLTTDTTQANQESARRAITYFEKELALHPGDLSTIWLLNIAYMQLGKYPKEVPEKWLIPAESFASEKPMPVFKNIAATIGIDFPNTGGGLIYEDFNGDNLLDIFTGGWGKTEHCYYLVNNGDGTFTDLTEASGMIEFPAGLHMMQTDYNNDGLPDIFILRGALLGTYGILPNSLLRNNGDNTFTDVTYESGLFSCHPTQTAVWADFNNDGWLDVFIGNEGLLNREGGYHPCELYINRNGYFTNRAHDAGLDFNAFVKGVAAGDMDNDGDQDIYVSINGENNRLFRNDTRKGSNECKFKDISEQAGIAGPVHSFSCWFFDFNNDGFEDILNFSFNGNATADDIAAEYLHQPIDRDITALYVNNGDGTFTNKSEQAGLDKSLMVIGSGFGDIDNDGWLDFYLGTGNPTPACIIPNRFFCNNGGKDFLETTVDMRVGHLQKGHAITMSDLNNDGYVDIGVQMGGLYESDESRDCLFLNPAGFGNNWVAIELVGEQTNKIAIGAKIILNINDNGVNRNIYRVVGDNSSYGTGSLRQTIGLNNATVITSITVFWPVSDNKTVIRNVPVNQFITIWENETGYKSDKLTRLEFRKREHAEPQGNPSP